MRTRFTELFSCEHPIQLAGMGGVGTVELAAAVARGGGVGMLPALEREPLPARIERAHDLAGARARIGVNVLMPFLDRAVVEQAAGGGACLVEFFYADPDPKLVELAREHGAPAGWQVGSVEEARAAIDAGCEVVIAQGVEAGGHVRGTTPLVTLLDEVLALAAAVVVIGAGGIATGRQVAAVLAMGADAVRIGTRYVATPEANAHDLYRDALLVASGADTVLTTAFASGWPDAPHRVLQASVAAAEALPAGTPGRLSPIPPTQEALADPRSMAMYAGMSVGSIGAVEPAEALTQRLAQEAEAHLQRLQR